MSINRIPLHAERLFATLCAADGITCNKATEDEEGWDYFLQFSPKKRTGVPFRTPLDMMPPSLSCLVQIKSNSGDFRGVKCKLSNALRLATTPMAAFVGLFVYSNADDQPDIYLLHIWDKEIEKILKRVREHEAEGQQDLNRRFITFNSSSMLRVDQSKLLKTIDNVISLHGTKYSEIKTRLVGEVGFEDFALQGTIKFKEGTTIDEIAETQIGLRDHLDGVSLSADSVRFGVAIPLFQLDSGTLIMRSYPRECVLQISSAETGMEVAIPSELLVPALPDLTVENLKFRITNKFIELYSRGDHLNATVNLHPKLNLAHSLNDIAIALDLLSMANSERLHIRATYQGTTLFNFWGQLDKIDMSASLVAIRSFISKFQPQLANTLPNTQDMFLLSEFLDQAEIIYRINELSSSDEVLGSCEINWVDKPYSGPALCLFHTCIELSGFSFYLIVRRQIEVLKKIDGKTPIKMTNLDFILPRILRGTRAQTEPSIVNEAQAHAKSISGIPVLAFSDSSFPLTS